MDRSSATARQFSDINRTARFDASGVQTDATFGTVNGLTSPSRPPRIVQISARVSF